MSDIEFRSLSPFTDSSGISEMTWLSSPQLRHDNLGNRCWDSNTNVYVDRSGSVAPASLVVSPEGERWIKSNKQILRDINQGVQLLLNDDDYVEFQEGRILHKFNSGHQSHVYKLYASGEQYIIKTLKTDHSEKDLSARQPYIYEMLQTQSISRDLSPVLEQFGLSFPRYLFATSHTSAMHFEDGIQPECHDFENRREGIRHIVRYVREQRAASPLWDHVSVDYRMENFVKRPDDTIVWVDPFCYVEEKNNEWIK